MPLQYAPGEGRSILLQHMLNIRGLLHENDSLHENHVCFPNSGANLSMSKPHRIVMRLTFT